MIKKKINFIIIFLNVIFIILILIPNNVKAYNSTTFRIDYDSLTFSSDYSDIITLCNNTYSDNLLVMSYELINNVITPSATYSFSCFNLSNSSHEFYFFNNLGMYNMHKLRSIESSSFATIFNSDLSIFNSGTTSEIEALTITASSFANRYVVNDIDFNVMLDTFAFFPIYSSNPIYYNTSYDSSNTSHFYVNDVEILDGDVIPLPFNVIIPTIEFENNYNQYNSQAILTIDFNTSNYVNQYSIDGGTNWVNVGTETINVTINENIPVISRIVDFNGDLIASATYNISNIISPSINFNISYNKYNTQANISIEIDLNMYTNQYSIDGGTNWINFDQETCPSIKLTTNGFIIARVYDVINNEVVTSKTLNINKIFMGNELEESKNKFENEDTTTFDGIANAVETFILDITPAILTIGDVSSYIWQGLNGYIKYFILAIFFYFAVIAIVKFIKNSK